MCNRKIVGGSLVGHLLSTGLLSGALIAVLTRGNQAILALGRWPIALPSAWISVGSVGQDQAVVRCTAAPDLEV